MSKANKIADKIRHLDIVIEMERGRYEETISRAARIEDKIRKLRARRLTLLSKSKAEP